MGYIFHIHWRIVLGITNVNKLRFFTGILETVEYTNMFYISLQRSFYTTYAFFVCLKTHADMAEELQVKISCFIFICACMFMTLFFLFYRN